MATITKVSSTCDLCTKERDATTVVSYSFGKKAYEADVCGKHAADFQRFADTWTKAGRKST